MLLNRVEFALMNNPVRAAVHRLEARRLLRMGGTVRGGAALEIGCGRGVGAGIILDLFGAASVDAIDLDPRMASRAKRRLRGRPARVCVADCTALPVRDAVYDAVFDFEIIHHVPDWRAAIGEVARVLRPGGRFYAQEPLAGLINHPVTRFFLKHPEHDRFGMRDFLKALEDVGLVPGRTEGSERIYGWFTAVKPAR